MHTFFSLVEYGLGIKSAKNLFDLGIYVEDYYYNNSLCLKNVFKNETIKQIIDKAGIENLLRRSIYDLYAADVSVNILNLCYREGITIDALYKENNIIMNSIIGKSTYQKVIDGLERFDSIDLDTTTFTKNTLYRYLEFEKKSLNEIRNYFMTLNGYPMEHFIKDIDDLLEEKFLICDNNMISIAYPTLMEVLNECKEDTRNIVLEKINGDTLEVIAGKRGLSKECIRQKLEVAFASLPTVIEDRYAQIFQKYHWDEHALSFFYNISPIEYQYLKYRYGAGKLELYTILIDEKLTKEQIEYLHNHHNLISMDDVIFYRKKDIILKYFMSHVCEDKAILIDDLYNQYTNYLVKYNLEEYNWKNVNIFRNYLDECPFSINSGKDIVRLWDFTRLHDSDIYKISSLLHLSSGYYSTEILFRNNPLMMKKYDFQNEIELHNFLRRLVNHDDIIFRKAPNFIVGNISRDQFIFIKIQRLAPISPEDFLKYIEYNYGHKSKSFELQLRKYSIDKKTNLLVPVNGEFLPEDVEKIKSFFNFDIISFKKLEKLLSGIVSHYNSCYVKKSFVEDLGYTLYNGVYIVKQQIGNPIEYLKAQILSQDEFHYSFTDHADLTTLYYQCIEELQDDYQIICYEFASYYTKSKLDKLGVNRKKIIDYVNLIYEHAKNNMVITNKILSENFHDNELMQLNLPIKFYMSLLDRSNLFLHLVFDKLDIFIIKDLVGNSSELYSYIKGVIEKYGIENLIRILKERYDFRLPEKQIRSFMFERAFFRDLKKNFII